jgi:hypothetical protein
MLRRGYDASHARHERQRGSTDRTGSHDLAFPASPGMPGDVMASGDRILSS